MTKIKLAQATVDEPKSLKRRSTSPKPWNPLWVPQRDGVTKSLLETWLRCREQCRLKYVEGWTSRTPSEALMFGDGFHFALEHLPHGASEKQIVAMVQKWNSRLAQGGLTAAERKQRAKTKALLETTLIAYHARWHDADADIEWIGHEEQFNVPSGLTTPLNLRGKKDGVFRLNKRRRLFETKTRGTIDEMKTMDTLGHDLQAMLYCHAETVQHGEPSGVLYNVVRRSGLKLRDADTIKDYQERIAADIAERPDFYFVRWNIDLAAGEVAKWFDSTLRPMLEDLVEWFTSLAAANGNPAIAQHHYMNPGVLMAPESNELFRLLTTGSKFGLYKRGLCHPELAA